jgi:hypothetical protein
MTTAHHKELWEDLAPLYGAAVTSEFCITYIEILNCTFRFISR